MKVEKKLFGLDDHFKRALTALKGAEPILLYGPSGSGKTILADEIAKAYQDTCQNKIPIIYLQLYPEMTKGTLIGGETLRDGNVVVEPQIVATEGEKGAIFVIDECTHTTEPVLLAFNSLIEEPNTTVIGDKIYQMNKETRFIFCGNYPDHTGNIPLPTSFANRLYIEDVAFVDRDNSISIAKYYSGIDDHIAAFIIYIVENTRANDFPLSPRNVIKCARGIKRLEGTGFIALSRDIRMPDRVKILMRVLEEHKINPTMFKEVVLSSLQAHTKSRSQSPERVKALLW